MSTKTKEAIAPEIMAEKWLAALIDTARRIIAVRHYFPDCRVKFKRAARTGDAANHVLLIVIPKAGPLRAEVWPFSKLENLAGQVTEETAIEELRRWTAYGE